jgi:hypothetical protein
MYSEIYRELVPTLAIAPEWDALADRSNDPVQARRALMRTNATEFRGERSLVDFLEAVYGVLRETDEAGGLAERYFQLLSNFVYRFNVRYELRRPCVLCPTLEGIFGSLLRSLKTATANDRHLANLLSDFEQSIFDLRTDCSDARIRGCIRTQTNLLEGLGSAHPGVQRNTLGAICDQIGTWPHHKLKEAMQNLYGFASDYPAIRHAGRPGTAVRQIDMRDMVAVSVILAGFTPYLTDLLDPDLVYRGG